MNHNAAQLPVGAIPTACVVDYRLLTAKPTARLAAQVRDTINRLRDRMANLEATLGQTASHNQELDAELRFAREQWLFCQAGNFLAKKRLAEQQQSIADLEAQLAAYRRKAGADQKEIEALKTQLFA